jgi:sensor domain CHASE-containing protein
MAGTTTIRLTNQAKRTLDRLRDTLERLTNRKVTQQEAAERAIALAATHPNLAIDDWKPLSKAARKRLEALQGDYGAWSTQDIDEVIADQVR